MKHFSCTFLFLMITFLGMASKEWDFLDYVADLSIEKLEQLEKKYQHKNPVPFSEEQIRLKIIQANIHHRHQETVRYIETLIWMTNNKEIKNEAYLTWGHYHLSTLLSYYEITDLAIEQSHLCIDLARKSKNYYILNLVYSNLGTLYYKEKHYSNALHYMNLAKEVRFDRPSLTRASEHNNLGLCYLKLKQYQKAVHAYQKGLSLLKKPLDAKNENVYYLILGNLGNTYVLSGKPDKGIQLLNQELAYYDREHLNHADRASCLIDMIRYYELKKQYQRLPGLIDQTLDIIEQLETIEEKVRSMEKLIHLVEEKNITINELKLNKMYNAILIQSNKQFKDIRSSISKLLYEDKITALISRSKLEKRNYSMEQKNNKLILYASLILVIILVLLLISIIHTNKQRLVRSKQALIIQQQQEEIVKNEQIILQQQFQNQKQQLNSLLTNLSIKQKTESGFLEKIKKLKRKKNISPEQIIQELQLSINNLIDIDRKLINEDVLNFEINSDFSDRIKQKHPELTESEIRYCNYFIAGLSSKEIGLLHDLSDISVRVQKNKIKNKLGLGKEDSMIDYLKEFLF